jgi:dTDP-4-amino-4,6-dideoxygalactose transaminase
MESYNPLKEYAIEELKKRKLIKDAWDAVDLFEKTLAKYTGSKYAIAVDNCTDALFLCLKYLECDLNDKVITIPKNTYCSVPMTIYNAGCKYSFEDLEWSGTYQLKPYPVYDSALKLTKDMYIKDSFQCLSFHRKKILKLTKGGAILTDDCKAAEWFKTMRCKGRHPHKKILYTNENIENFGWNMYMHPEDAAKAFLIFEKLPAHNKDKGGSKSYGDLTKHEIFLKKEI